MNDNSIEFEIRSINDEERSVSGIAIPYGQTVNVGGYNERIERGAFKGTEIGSPLYFNHDHAGNRSATPIGTLTEVRDTDDGLLIKARISRTAKGDEVYTLLKDKVLTKFSAGFEPVEHRTDSDGTVVRTKAKLIEVSIVPRPAYSNAAVAEVRAADNNTQKENEEMTETVIDNSEVVELREQVSDLERKFAVLSDGRNTPAPSSQFRSGGEFLKALATGSEAATTEFRAFTGATSADSLGDRAAWVNEPIKLVEANREMLNLFPRLPLPASGNSIEFPRLAATTGTVGKQAAEGADLPYMEVSLTTATAPVDTYGGYTTLSRQAIERSDVAYLDLVLRFMAIEYANRTNAAVLDAFQGLTGQSVTKSADTAAGYLKAVLAARKLIKAANATADLILVNDTVFEKLATFVDANGRPLLSINGDGSNTFGNLNVANGVGSIAGIPVVLTDEDVHTDMVVLSREAISVHESAGAPFRLADENVVNLTKDFSLYGYMAVAAKNDAAVVRVGAGA